MSPLNNPGIRTLTGFLQKVHRNQPANYTRLSLEHSRGYGMLNRYIAYCLSEDLIKVTSETRTRGRYPSKTYALTEKGSTLLEALGGPTRATPSTPRVRRA